MKNVITEAVAIDLCSSCGVCAGHCPSSPISMKILGNGNLVPRMKAGRCLEKRHLCLDVWSFSSRAHKPN